MPALICKDPSGISESRALRLHPRAAPTARARLAEADEQVLRDLRVHP